jgi:hypothetical protein
MSERVSQSVVEEDRKLTREAETSRGALARHRWHWTLDESNLKRVSARAYAAAVGVSRQLIDQYAQGYALYQSVKGTLNAMTISDAIARAQMGAETRAAAEAVAHARGITAEAVRRHRPNELRRVRDHARELAEEKGTTIADEAGRVADFIVKAERTEARTEAGRRAKRTARYLELEGILAGAQRKLEQALTLSHQVDWGAEEQELLLHSLKFVKRLLELIDLAIVGTKGIDWDTEIKKLSGEVSR